ncbi:LytTR family transcriptional regulator DNA-binding domain-containing protein [Pontimicrobium aquaticum]
MGFFYRLLEFYLQQLLTYIDSLKNWIEKLCGEQFVQVHKSFIINSKKSR